MLGGKQTALKRHFTHVDGPASSGAPVCADRRELRAAVLLTPPAAHSYVAAPTPTPNGWRRVCCRCCRSTERWDSAMASTSSMLCIVTCTGNHTRLCYARRYIHRSTVAASRPEQVGGTRPATLKNLRPQARIKAPSSCMVCSCIGDKEAWVWRAAALRRRVAER